MNPLMATMGGNTTNNMQAMMQTIGNVKRMMQGGNPNTVMQMMAQQNPQFAKFMQDNQGKSPQQIAKENGLDWGMIQNLMK